MRDDGDSGSDCSMEELRREQEEEQDLLMDEYLDGVVAAASAPPERAAAPDPADSNNDAGADNDEGDNASVAPSWLSSDNDDANDGAMGAHGARVGNGARADPDGYTSAASGALSDAPPQALHAPPQAPQAAAADAGTVVRQNFYEALGYKRQKLSRPDDASAAPLPDPNDWFRDAKDISESRPIPCMLSWVMPVSTSFSSEVMSFELIYAHRCVDDTNYYAPVNAVDNDGLYAYLCQRVLALLESEEAREAAPIQAIAEALELPDADAVRGALRCDPPKPPSALVEPGMSEEASEHAGVAESPVAIEDVQAKFAQLTLKEESSARTVSSARSDLLGGDVSGNVLKVDDGRVFRATTRKEALDKSSVAIFLTDEHKTVVIGADHKGMYWKVKAQEGFGKDSDAIEIPCATEALQSLLIPSSWSLREVARCRRAYACKEKAHDAAIDPYKLCCLAAALAGEKTHGRWCELMRLAACNSFIGVDAKVGGRDVVDLWTCSSETALWRRDSGDHDFCLLLEEVCRHVSNLTHDTEGAKQILQYGIDRDFFSAVELASLLNSKDVREAEGKARVPKGLSLNERKAAQAVKMVTYWLQNNQSYLSCKLQTMLSNYSPETGKVVIKPALVRDFFARAVRAPDGKVEWNAEDIVCFSDRWAWDGATAAWRRIAPCDYATAHVGYPKPVYDEKRRQLLEGFLLEIHGDKAIVDWRIGLKSRALHKGQAGPICLASQGAAGGCKSLEATLTMKAWGTFYSKMIDPRTLQTIRNSSADGPSPALLELRSRRYVVADEVAHVSPEVIKRLLGGGKTTARGLHQDPVTFELEFPVLELLSNLPDSHEDRIRFPNDDGMVRRLRACHFTNSFKNCANSLEARRAICMRERLQARASEGSNRMDDEESDDDEDEDEDDPTFAAITTDRLPHREGDARDPDVAHALSFPHTMFPEKWDMILDLAPDLMLLMTEVHAKAVKPGGSWPDKTDKITRWTSMALASAATKNPIQEPLRRAFVRCGCRVKANPTDLGCPTTNELMVPLVEDGKLTDKPSTAECQHWVSLRAIRAKLKIPNSAQDKRTVLQVACGNQEPISPEGTQMLIAKIEELRCFPSDPDRDEDYRVDPTSEVKGKDTPLALVVASEYTNDKGKKKKNGVRGLKELEMPTQYDPHAGLPDHPASAADAANGTL